MVVNKMCFENEWVWRTLQIRPQQCGNSCAWVNRNKKWNQGSLPFYLVITCSSGADALRCHRRCHLRCPNTPPPLSSPFHRNVRTIRTDRNAIQSDEISQSGIDELNALHRSKWFKWKWSSELGLHRPCFSCVVLPCHCRWWTVYSNALNTIAPRSGFTLKWAVKCSFVYEWNRDHNEMGHPCTSEIKGSSISK